MKKIGLSYVSGSTLEHLHILYGSVQPATNTEHDSVLYSIFVSSGVHLTRIYVGNLKLARFCLYARGAGNVLLDTIGVVDVLRPIRGLSQHY